MLELALTILAILACMGLSFFFSGSETAVISVNRYRLRGLHEQGDPEAGRLLTLLNNTQRLLILMLLGTNVANVFAALLFERLMQQSLADAGKAVLGPIRWSEMLSLVVLTPTIIIFAEVLPKALFRAHADRLAGSLRSVYVACVWVFFPAIWVVEKFAHLMLGPLTEARSRAVRRLTRQDVINLLQPDDREGESQPAIPNGGAGDAARPDGQSEAAAAGGVPVGVADEEGDERHMVENILRLHQTIAEEIMTPLVNLVAIRLGQVDLNGLRAMAVDSGYSRYPVFRDRVVHIIGFIDIYRVLREDDGTKKLEDFIETPHYVPETKRVDDLLQEFLDLRIKNAIVVDEYGGCSGWISREDIIEEIVGELEDELDEHNEPIVMREEGVFEVEARLEIDALNLRLGTAFSAENWTTLAGLVLNEMGRIPHPGDKVTIDGWRIKVLEMDRRRIAKVELRRNQ